MNDLNPNKVDGFYPKCLKTPFLVFGVIVAVLFVVAIMLCRGGVPDCCKNAESTAKITDSAPKNAESTAESTPKIAESAPKEPQKFDDIKQEGKALTAITTLADKPKKPLHQIAQEQFLQTGKIIDGYTFKVSVFFDKNSSFLGKKQQETFAASLLSNAKDAKVALVMGYGCDLGDKKYNHFLINKRIERTIKAIKKQYPNMQIASSNEGQLRERSDEKGREMERRVDIYFY
ncbi:hypothetical protein [Helicobacter sp. 23-1045]